MNRLLKLPDEVKLDLAHLLLDSVRQGFTSLAEAEQRDKELEAALFEKQSPSMTRDDVVSALQQVAQISSADFDAKYAKTLEAVRVDVALGQKLGVQGTPTFYLNGIKLPQLRPAYFDAALDWAVRRFATGS